jgi:hypothetical protein
MQNTFSNYKKQTGESLPQTMGSPAGNRSPRSSATDKLTDVQEGLRGSRNQ